MNSSQCLAGLISYPNNKRALFSPLSESINANHLTPNYAQTGGYAILQIKACG
ncbi:hypothetical protein B4092_1585 [Bacillus licheniformis]|nr:hypothetical protein B4092_1585 [Bacillus licheniformis]TWK47249.1 hypothetical protein CHCC20345_4211 [Bacillus licheniformis]TWM93971.1 hypothetical protein CHCC14598_1462 [Bacillus licheniformis]